MDKYFNEMYFVKLKYSYFFFNDWVYLSLPILNVFGYFMWYEKSST